MRGLTLIHGMDFVPALKRIDTSSTAVTIADAAQEDTPLIYTNDAFRTLTGYDDDEILGRNCRFLQGRDTDGETVMHVKRAVDGRFGLFRCLLNYKKSGKKFYNLLALAPLKIGGRDALFLGCQCEINKDIKIEKVRSHYFSMGRIEDSLQGIEQKTDELLLNSARTRIDAIKLMIDNYFMILKSSEIRMVDRNTLSGGNPYLGVH